MFTPSRDDLQVLLPMPRVDDEDLVEVYTAGEEYASTTRREEEDDLFDVYDGRYQHRHNENKH